MNNCTRKLALVNTEMNAYMHQFRLSGYYGLYASSAGGGVGGCVERVRVSKVGASCLLGRMTGDHSKMHQSILVLNYAAYYMSHSCAARLVATPGGVIHTYIQPLR